MPKQVKPRKVRVTFTAIQTNRELGTCEVTSVEVVRPKEEG